MFEIIEKSLVGKSTDLSLCEDGLFINDYFIAVIDGVTSKGKQLWNGHSSGKYAKEILLQTLSLAPYTIKASNMITLLNTHLQKAYEDDILKDDMIEWLRASIIIYSDYHHEIWSFGDCQCYINQTLHQHTKLIDTLYATLRSQVIQHALLEGLSLNQLKKNDIGRTAILPLLKTQFHFENREGKWGYCILNGHLINPYQVTIYSIKAGDEIVLASDGYPKLYPSLVASEQALNYVITHDPLCFYLYPSTKGIQDDHISYDDRCYIKFKVT